MLVIIAIITLQSLYYLYGRVSLKGIRVICVCLRVCVCAIQGNTVVI